MPVIFLDDVEISVKNNGFSVDDFVGYVKKDTTFYMGFKNLRYYSHNYESELNIFNKKGKVIKLKVQKKAKGEEGGMGRGRAEGNRHVGPFWGT